LERVLQPAGASGPAMFGEEDASATKGAPESSAAPPSASLRPPSRPPTPMPAPNTIGEAEVSTERGQALGVFPCTSVSRGGLFLCTEGPLPPLMSLVRLRLPQLGGLTCEAQVVQHLRPDKAKQWHMSPGFGVQFGVLSEVQRSVLKEAALGHVVPPTPLPARPDRDDALAAAALARYAPKAGQDWYALLGVKREADFDEIRQKAREAKRTLEALAERPLSEGQRTQLAATIKRIETARDAIGLPGHRAEYDAASGNFEGVWRCLAAGLSVTELELARGRFLASHAGAESHGNVSFVTGQAFEKAGAIKDALASYAQGLTADPLNLRLHKLYWALKQRGGRSA
jgi:hypothetical protein